MRVAMLIWSFWPGHEGGAERQCRKVIEELEHQGVKFFVLTSLFHFKAIVREEYLGGEIVRLGIFAPIETVCRSVLIKTVNYLLSHLFAGLKTENQTQSLLFWLMFPVVWLARLSFIYSLHHWFSKNSDMVQVIHVHEADWLAGVAAWIGGRHQIPVVAKTATAPALPKIGYDVPSRGFWHKWRMHCFFIAQHHGLVDDLAQNGVPKERIFLLPNGVNIPDSVANPRNLGPVLYVGNFSQGVHRKAFDILILAWAQVSRRIPTAQLNLLGAGDFTQWLRLAEELNCERSMRFLGNVSDPSSYYEHSCIFYIAFSARRNIKCAVRSAKLWSAVCCFRYFRKCRRCERRYKWIDCPGR
jgi:glycosyltransferase involved in cell wall biosynthesis